MKTFLTGLFIVGGFALFVLGAPNQVHAADTILASEYEDADFDGQVDYIRWRFDETVTACDYEAGDWTVNTAGDINFVIEGVSCTIGQPSILIAVDSDAGETYSTVTPVISYANNGTSGSISLNMTGAMTAKSNVNVDDSAAPSVTASNPTAGDKGVIRDNGIELTFSEPMVTTMVEGAEFTVSPDPGDFTVTWSNGNQTVDLDAGNFACSVEYELTLTTDIDAAQGTVTSLNDDVTIDFVTRSSGCGSSIEDTDEQEDSTETISFETETAGITFETGDIVEIDWSIEGEAIQFVNLLVSYDVGVTYEALYKNVPKENILRWRVPQLEQEHVLFKIEGTDLATVIDDDVSDAFAIQVPFVDLEPVELPEPILPGTLVRAEGFDTIYFVTENMERRVFADDYVFLTYHESFDEIKVVDVEVLAEMPLIGLMLPKPGVVLVRVNQVPGTYVLRTGVEENDVTLRKFASDEVAEAAFGADWEDFVVDVDVTLFNHFSLFEADLTLLSLDTFFVDRDAMKKREVLEIE